MHKPVHSADKKLKSHAYLRPVDKIGEKKCSSGKRQGNLWRQRMKRGIPEKTFLKKRLPFFVK
jgi:hypothetical protein